MIKNSSQKQIKILIVDDEAQIQKLLSYGLSDLGWSLLKASSGEEALKILAAENPACILLDVGLPKMSGIETLKELRSFSHVPVIMLTVEDDDALKVEALELGADDPIPTLPLFLITNLFCPDEEAVNRSPARSERQSPDCPR
jgi:DNA-binding response OmpR family regulator